MRAYIFILAAVLLVVYSASATIINIPGDYPTIQQGIDGSYDGDTVLVKPGEYVENVSIVSKNIILASHFLTTGDTSYISMTIINGDSSFIVVSLGQIYNYAAITGFTIKYGSLLHHIGGGGIQCASSSNIEISYNKIHDNYFRVLNDTAGGGGICCYNSTGTIRNNAIFDNIVENGGFGGGIFCKSSDIIIANNRIFYNTACWGGGIGLYESNAVVRNNVIYENDADI